MADDAGGPWWRDAGIAARLVAVGVIIRAFEARILTRTAAPGMVLVSIRAELLRAYVKGAMPAGQPWLSALLLWRRSVFRRWSTGNFPRRTILEVWPESHCPGFVLHYADVLQSYTA